MGLPRDVDERAKIGEDLRNLQRVKESSGNTGSAADREITEQLEKLARLPDDGGQRFAGS